MIMINSSSKTAVVITTLNVEKYIEGCLYSLITQYKKPYEVIIVDAGSIDNSQKIIENFSNILNIKFIKKIGCDMGMGRNVGIQSSSSDYITFLDADDRFLPSHIALSAFELDNNKNADYVYGDNLYFISDSKRWGKRSSPSLPLNKFDMLRGNNYSLNSLTIRSSLLMSDLYLFLEGEYGRYCEDWSCQIKLLLKEVPFKYINKPISLVNIRNDSHTSWNAQVKTSLIMSDILRKKIHDFNKISFTKKENFYIQKMRDFLSVKYIISSIIARNFDNLLKTENISKKSLCNISGLLYFLCVNLRVGIYLSYILKLMWRQKVSLNIKSIKNQFLYNLFFH